MVTVENDLIYIKSSDQKFALFIEVHKNYKLLFWSTTK